MPNFNYERKSFISHGYEVTMWDLSKEGLRDRLEIKPLDPISFEVDYFKTEGRGTITLPAGTVSTDDIPDLIKNLENVKNLIEKLKNNEEVQKLNIL